MLARLMHKAASTRWFVWILLVAASMAASGIVLIVSGILATLHSDLYLAQRGMLGTVDYRVMGETYLILGILIFVAGGVVLSGQSWARTVGMVLAGFGIVASIVFFVAYPIASIIVIILDLLAMCGLVVSHIQSRSRSMS